MNFTPGPWLIAPINTTHAQLVNDHSRAALRVEQDGSAEGLCNLRLAAAAPTLLDACEQALLFFSDNQDEPLVPEELVKILDHAIATARSIS